MLLGVISQVVSGLVSLIVLGLAAYGAWRYHSRGLGALAFGRLFSLVYTGVWMFTVGAPFGAPARMATAPNVAVMEALSLVGMAGNAFFSIAAVLLLLLDFRRYLRRAEEADAHAARVLGGSSAPIEPPAETRQ